MNTKPNSPQGHAAAGQWYGRQGLRPVTKSTTPPTNRERLSAWAAKSYALPMSQRLGVA